MSNIDMTLDEATEHATDFKSETPMANIWTIDDQDDDLSKDVVVSDMEEELEKPSFLRRLTKRGQQKTDLKDDDKEDSKDDHDDNKKDTKNNIGKK
jgi:hypothetical protein